MNKTNDFAVIQAMVKALPFAAIATLDDGSVVISNTSFLKLFDLVNSSKPFNSIRDIIHIEDERLTEIIDLLDQSDKTSINISSSCLYKEWKVSIKVGKLNPEEATSNVYLWIVEQANTFADTYTKHGCGIFHQIFDPLIACDENEALNIVEINQSAANLLGYEPSELAGTSLLEIITTPGGEEVKHSNLNGEKTHRFQLKQKKGNKLEIMIRRLYNHSYGHHAAVFALQQVNAEVELKDELIKEKQYFEYLLQSVPFGIVVLDEEDRVVDSNNAFNQLFDYAPSQLAGQKINDLIVPKDLKNNSLYLTNSVAKGHNIYIETKRQNSQGQIIDVAITGKPIVLPNGQKRVFGIYQDIQERIKLQQSIEDEKNFFRSLFDNVPFGIAIIDTYENIIDCNNKFTEIFGYSHKEVIAHRNIDLIFPEGLEKEGKDFRSKVLNGEFLYQETLRKHKSGHAIDVAITAVMISRLSGEKYIFGIYQDISDRKLAEKKLQASERQLADMVEYLPGMVYRCKADQQYTMLFASEGSSRVTGYTPSSFTSSAITFSELILDSFKEEIWQKWQQVIKEDILFDFEYQIYHADGNIQWVWERGRAVKDDNGRVRYLEGYIENITDSRKLQDSLRKERDLLQALMDNIPDTIYFKDRDSKFIRINKAQARMLGVDKPEDAVNKADDAFFDAAHAEKAYEDEQLMMETGTPVINKMEHIQTAKGWRWFTATKVPLRDTDGKIQGLAGISRDITEIKALEEKLRESEKNLSIINQEKDKLFSVIAHDLRSPFNSFLLMTEMLADEVFSFDKEELINLTGSMYRTATSVSELLENLLEWSRIQRGLADIQFQNIIISDIIHKNLDYFQAHLKSKEIHLSLFVNDDISVCADSSMLSSIIRNLVSNAIKFTPHNGFIKIFASKPDEDRVLIRVEDSGVGMSDELQQKLFSVETRGRKGTDDEPSSGLGLILVKEFVENMNGKIYLKSKVNVGSTFYVELPADCSGLML